MSSWADDSACSLPRYSRQITGSAGTECVGRRVETVHDIRVDPPEADKFDT